MDTHASRKRLAASFLLRDALLGILLCALGLLCLWVLQPFLSPILWAAILAYVTWPLHSRLRTAFRRFTGTAALVTTVLVGVIVVAPVFWLLILLQRELVDAYRELTAFLSRGPHPLPEFIRNLPGLGSWLQDTLDRYASDPAALNRELILWLQHWAGQLTALLSNVGRNLAKLALTLLTLFFFYRDGDALVRQCRAVTTRFLGDRLDRAVRAAGLMTRAVVYGLLSTAFAQGLIAGIGYRVAGLQAPVLLGVLTGLLSTAPLLGTAFVWAPLGIWLIVSGDSWKGALLLAWGALLVHPTDNVLRPLLISNVTRVPFLLVMFGALGGLAAFGLVGIFIGPVLLAMGTATWRELAERTDSRPA